MGLQGGGTGPGLNHGPAVVSPRLPVELIVDTPGLGLKINTFNWRSVQLYNYCVHHLGRLYHGLGVPEEAFLIFHSEVSMDPDLRHSVYLDSVKL